MVFRRGIVQAYSSEILFLFRLLDAVSVLVAGLASYYAVADRLLPGPGERSYLTIIAVFSFVLLAEKINLYGSQRGKKFSNEVARIGFVCVAVSVIVFSAHQLVSWPDPSIRLSIISWLAHWFVSLLVIMVSSRFVLRRSLQWLRSRGWNLKHAVIAGNGINLKQVMDILAQHPEFGFQVDGFFDDRAADRRETKVPCQRLGQIADLKSYIAHKRVDEVWIGYPMIAASRCQEVLNQLQESTVDIRSLMDANYFTGSAAHFTDFAGLPLLDIEVTPLQGLGYYYKLLEDKIVATLAVVLLSPLFAAIAIGVKLSSPGPVFYRQERISWNNRRFVMLKFRTMPVGAEDNTGPTWATKGEGRATRFGTFLRKTSLDELPQFVNVLKGDMSVVGPRPERPCFVEQFKDQIPAYMKKHMVKAGITGWAQVNGLRGDTDLEERIQHDLFYIRNWSLMFDLTIAIKTFVNGFVNKNAY